MQPIEQEFAQRFAQAWKQPSLERLVALLHPMSYFINRTCRRSAAKRRHAKNFTVYSVGCRTSTEKLTGFTVLRAWSLSSGG